MTLTAYSKCPNMTAVCTNALWDCRVGDTTVLNLHERNVADRIRYPVLFDPWIRDGKKIRILIWDEHPR
jgi:hypothetical protein